LFSNLLPRSGIQATTGAACLRGTAGAVRVSGAFGGEG
jgi:hypothetical protein